MTSYPKSNNAAVNEIIKDGRLRSICNRMANGEDIFQDVILAILEMPQDRIQTITEGGYLIFYAITMANRIGGAHNKLSKYYNAQREQLTDKLPDRCQSQDLSDKVSAQIQLQKIDNQMATMSWYDREIFKLYMEFGSFRKVEAETGIPYSSVRVTVEKVRGRLKNL